MTTLRPTLTELTSCYELFEHSDACLNCIWQDACQERRNIMVNVSGDLMDNPKVATALQLLKTKPKSIYPLCYCKVCKGDTKHKDCPNQDNPKPRATSTWFRALRGEPIIAVGGG